MQVIKNIDHHKYKHYSVEDLLQDDYFIFSGINATKESDEFWEEVLRNKHISREDYDLACYLVKSLQIKDDAIFPNEIDRLWKNVSHEHAQIRRRRKNKKRKLMFRWLPGIIASLLLILFLYERRPAKDDANVHASVSAGSIEAVKAPDEPAAKIQLILENEEVVAVEGAEADIVYEDEGIAINNNDRKVIKKPTGTTRITYNQLIVPNGKRSALTFEDGSKMWVNAGTRVVYPAHFTDDKREIYVDGEAYLDVSHDEARPFIVKSENFSVNVLGTSFNITAYESDSCQYIVLVSGSVGILSGDNAETVLSPDEMYILENGNAHVETVPVEYYTSWKAGMYQYKSERLDVIMKRLSRYYGKEIVCRREVAHLKCSGKLDLKDDLNSILNGISYTAPVCYQYNSDRYIITNR
ncbi:MAG: FecR domain-containing protein [Tannerella sp.]|jgi:hypothetical protein|nr:FecR domain-containing protein [Tannerella sp.]